VDLFNKQIKNRKLKVYVWEGENKMRGKKNRENENMRFDQNTNVKEIKI